MAKTKKTSEKERIRKPNGPPFAEWSPKFLDLLHNSGNVRRACKGANISRAAAYKYRSGNARFAEQWQDAMADAVDLLEAMAWKRATQEANPSDLLLIFLLKAHRPDLYREVQKHELTGQGGKDLIPRSDLSHLTDEELGELQEILERADARRDQTGASGA